MKRKRKSNKLQLSKRTRAAIKRDFDTLPYDKLNKEEQRYYNLIKAGKKRQSTGVKFNGKFISKNLSDMFKKVAERRGMTLNNYLKTNKADIKKLLEKGYSVSAPKSHEFVIEKIEGLKSKTIDVKDGNGIVRQSKGEAIARIQMLAQHAFSTTYIVVLLFEMTIYQTGRLQITCPESDSYVDLIGEEFTDFLDDFFPDIQYIQSDRKGIE